MTSLQAFRRFAHARGAPLSVLPAGMGRSVLVVIIVQHAVLGAFDVVIVAALDGPEEEQPCPETKGEGKDDQKREGPHGFSSHNALHRQQRFSGTVLLLMTGAGVLRSIDAFQETRLSITLCNDELDVPLSDERKFEHAAIPAAPFVV